MSYKDKAGRGTADETISTPAGPEHWPELRCRADGCRLAWSVDTADRNKLCSYHAWEEPKAWPFITDSLLQSGPWRLPRSKSPGVEAMKRLLRGNIGNVQ